MAPETFVSPYLSLLDRGIKRAFDLVSSSTGLVVFAPVILALSLAIKLDSRGPIFIHQTRYSYKNQIVQVLEFRSRATRDGKMHFLRVTSVGHVLRRTGINELLQLFNVLRGEMSIVGPSLHATRNNVFEGQIWRFSRCHVKPGIIGWAQVHGYGEDTATIEYMKQRMEYDLYYIENWSLLLDIKIIVMAIFAKKSYTRAD